MILISEGRRCQSHIARRYSSISRSSRPPFCTICAGSASGKLCRTQESGLSQRFFIAGFGQTHLESLKSKIDCKRVQFFRFVHR